MMEVKLSISSSRRISFASDFEIDDEYDDDNDGGEDDEDDLNNEENDDDDEFGYVIKVFN